jgi:hypothetical protein
MVNKYCNVKTQRLCKRVHIHASIHTYKHTHTYAANTRTYTQIVTVLEDFLTDIQTGRRSANPKGDLIVFGTGMWEIIVHNMPVEQFLILIEKLAGILRELREGYGVRCAWLTPIARTAPKLGILPGKLLRVSLGRVFELFSLCLKCDSLFLCLSCLSCYFVS